MPTNITEVDTFTATVPVPNDGEGVTAASVLQFAQPLANRTKNLNGILKTSGVYRHKVVADVATLKAIAVAGVADHDFRYLDGIGFYFYDSTTTPSGDTLPVIIKPGSGAGQWLHELVGLYGITDGIATLTGNKLTQNIANQPVATGEASFTGTGLVSSTSSLTWANALTMDVAGTVNGDYIMVHANCQLASAAGGGTAAARIASQDNYTGTPSPTGYDDTRAFMHGTDSHSISLTKRVPVSVNGTTRIYVQLQGDGTNTGTLYGPWIIDVLHIRP